MMEHTIVKIRQLLESAASIDKLLRDLRASPDDAHIAYVIHSLAQRSGRFLTIKTEPTTTTHYVFHIRWWHKSSMHNRDSIWVQSIGYSRRPGEADDETYSHIDTTSWARLLERIRLSGHNRVTFSVEQD